MESVIPGLRKSFFTESESTESTESGNKWDTLDGNSGLDSSTGGTNGIDHGNVCANSKKKDGK